MIDIPLYVYSLYMYHTPNSWYKPDISMDWWSLLKVETCKTPTRSGYLTGRVKGYLAPGFEFRGNLLVRPVLDRFRLLFEGCAVRAQGQGFGGQALHFAV